MKTMNRFNRLLTAMGATAFILCGCEQNDSNPVDEAPVAARITSTIAAQNTDDNDRAPSTRASETSWANGDLIGVSASSATGATSYTNIKYAATGTAGNFAVVNAADDDNDIYFQDQKSTDFSAYYPYTGTNGTLPGTDGILERTLTAADQASASLPAIDYLWAPAASASSAAPQVKFNFQHSMSRISLNFKEGDDVTFGDELTYTLDGLVLEGTFNTLTGAATATAGTAAGKLENLSVATGSSQGAISYLILWPQTVNSATLTVIVDGTTYRAAISFRKLPGSTSQEKGLAGGYSYLYNVKVNKTKMIIEEAIITPWIKDPDQDVDAWS